MKRKEKKTKKQEKSVNVKTGQKQETKINIKIGDIQKKKNVKRRSTPARPRVSYVSVPPIVLQQTVPPKEIPKDYFQKPTSRTITEIMDPAPIRSANDVEQEQEKVKSKVEKNAEEQQARLKRMREVNERKLSAEEKKFNEEIRKASTGFDMTKSIYQSQMEEANKAIFGRSGPRIFQQEENKGIDLQSSSTATVVPGMMDRPTDMDATPQASPATTPAPSPTPKKRGRPRKAPQSIEDIFDM